MALPKIFKEIDDQVSAVNSSGDTMKGALRINEGLGQLNAYTWSDGATYLELYAKESENNKRTVLQLNSSPDENGNPAIRLLFRDENLNVISTSALYGQHNKPTPSEIGALSLSGGTMNGHLYLQNNTSVIQNQNTTSNYTTVAIWHKGGVASSSYMPQIGCHNTGDDGNGSIVILPYATEKSPWQQEVGLYVGSKNLYYNGSSILNTSNFTSWVPKKDGTGASGTWGINITGNASTATSATKATQDQHGYNIYDNYSKRHRSKIDLTNSSYNVNTWYPVMVSIPSYGIHRVACVCQLNADCTPSWGSHARGFTAVVEILTISGSWGTTGAGEICLMNDQRWLSDSGKPPVGYNQFSNSSRAVFFLRGGAKYSLETDWIASWEVKTVAETLSGQEIGPTTTYPGVKIKYNAVMGNLYIPTDENYSSFKARNIAVGTSGTPQYNGDVYMKY